MNTKIFIEQLKQCDVDTDKAISRFMGNEDLFRWWKWRRILYAYS